MKHESSSTQASRPEDWSEPKPAVLARPTWWPAAMALGSTLLAWGIVTSFVIVALGTGVFAISLGGWIREIRLEQEESAQSGQAGNGVERAP
jgi:hypothetical protein